MTYSNPLDMAINASSLAAILCELTVLSSVAGCWLYNITRSGNSVHCTLEDYLLMFCATVNKLAILTILLKADTYPGKHPEHSLTVGTRDDNRRFHGFITHLLEQQNAGLDVSDVESTSSKDMALITTQPPCVRGTPKCTV
jgi:hypothetical protein